ncbi:MAG: trigger factor [Synechococcales bacterium]|nr:trigger factor [Synechococcales bacterium]
MKVTQEKLPASQIGLEIEITPEMTQKAYEQAIQKFMRQANIPGFRKGKVPRQVILQRFGSEGMKATALETLIDDCLKQALKQENIASLGNYQLRSDFSELVTRYDPGQPLVFKAAVDVQPEVILKQYTDLSIKAEEVKADPDKVDQTLENYRKQMATLVPVEDRAAEATDSAVVSYHGRFTPAGSEEEDVPGGQAEDFSLDLDDESRFIPGFIAGIRGMKVGETKELDVHFPDDYFNEQVKGQAAKFTITLQDLKERELPELDDEFASELTEGEFETLAALRDHLEKRYQDEAEEQTKANKETAILNALLEQVEVELPETLVDQELNYMLSQTAMQLQQQGLDIRKLFTQENIPQLKARSRGEAVDRIKRTLALGEVAKQEKITVDEAALEEKVQSVMEDLADQNIDGDRLREVLTEEMLKEQILTWLEEHSTLELVPEGSLEPPDAATESDESEEAAEEVVEVVAEEVVEEASS